MLLSTIFHDKRITALILVVWLGLSFCIFFSLGVLHSSFFRFGPSEKLHFMSICVDTWGEWVLLSFYCCIDTLIKSFGHDATIPWLTTTVADSKSKILPYSKCTCLLIVEVYYGYVHMSYIFKFFLSFTQFDFVLIAALSDMAMKIYSYSSYMENKTFAVPTSPDSEKLIEMQDRSDQT
jgi:hypothetical protein